MAKKRKKRVERPEEGWGTGVKGKYLWLRHEHGGWFKAIVVVVSITVLILVMRGCVTVTGMNKQSETPITSTDATPEPLSTEDPDAQVSDGNGTDTMLLQMQTDLTEEYGPAKDGFLWDQTGELLSKGVNGMSSEDAVFTYLRAISTMDMSTVQLLSRGSTVFQTVNDWNDSANNVQNDSSEDFKKRVYQSAMKSLQIEGISDSTVFAQTKRAYTVKGEMLDLTDKDFWVKDKKSLFKELYKYDNNQSDSTKSQLYLQNYILNYYQSGKAKLAPVSFSLTVEKFADINSGWLVSIDSELNSQFLYSDGTSVESYILEKYQDYKMDNTRQ